MADPIGDRPSGSPEGDSGGCQKPSLDDVSAYMLLEVLLIRFYEEHASLDDVKCKLETRITFDIEGDLLRECIEANFGRLEGDTELDARH